MSTDIAQIRATSEPADHFFVFRASKSFLISCQEVIVKIGNCTKSKQFAYHPKGKLSIIFVEVVFDKQNLFIVFYFTAQNFPKLFRIVFFVKSGRIQIAERSIFF